MILVINSQGGLVQIQDEDIFQGSTNLNTIHLIAPFADSVTFKAMFEMPDGTYKPNDLDGYVMQPSITLSKELNVWKLPITFPITQDYGTVNMQLRGTIGDTVVCTTTVKLSIQKGIPYASNFEELGDKDQLLQFIADIRALLSNKVDKVNYVYEIAENITSTTVGTYYVYDSGTDSYIPKTLPGEYASGTTYYEAISTGRIANRNDGIVIEFIDNKLGSGMSLKIEKDNVTINGKKILFPEDLIEPLNEKVDKIENVYENDKLRKTSSILRENDGVYIEFTDYKGKPAGKNVLKLEDGTMPEPPAEIAEYFQPGSFSNTDNTINVTNSGNTSFGLVYGTPANFNIELKPNTTYTISGSAVLPVMDYSASPSSPASIEIYSGDKQLLSIPIYNERYTPFAETFTTDSNITYRISFTPQVVNGGDISTIGTTYFNNLQIEEGSASTSFEAYIHSEASTKLKVTKGSVLINGKDIALAENQVSQDEIDAIKTALSNILTTIRSEISKADRKDGFTHTTDMNLVIGEPSVSYNSDDGIVVVSQSQIIANGKEYSPTVENRIPIVGSEGVVIDAQEQTNKIEIHLDASVTAKLARSLVLPISTPTETKIVVVDNTNSQKLLSLGSGLYIENDEIRATGGGGTGGGTIITEGGVELETWNADKKADTTALQETNTNVSNNSSKLNALEVAVGSTVTDINNLKNNKLDKLESSANKELVNVNSEGKIEKTTFTANHLIGLKEQDLTPGKNVLKLENGIAYSVGEGDYAPNPSTFSNTNNTVNVTNGTAPYDTTANLPICFNITLKPNTTYTFSGEVLLPMMNPSDNPSYGADILLGKGHYDGGTSLPTETQLFGIALYNSNYTPFNQTFTTDDTTDYCLMFGPQTVNASIADLRTTEFYNLQIEEGETATAFEPYKDTTEDKVLYASDITIEKNTATGNYMLVINKG